jgi:hypothetical protein
MSVYECAAAYALTYLTIRNGRHLKGRKLDRRKFKDILLPMSGFSLSNCKYIRIFMIKRTSVFLLHILVM